MTATALSIPLTVDAWQLLYKSIDSHWNATADVACDGAEDPVDWPRRTLPGLLSDCGGQCLGGSQCSPAYALTAWLAAVKSNAATETAQMSMLLARGWAVVTSDYDGPDSEFLAGPQAGFVVLDGICAALQFGPDVLGEDPPGRYVGILRWRVRHGMGHSLQKSHTPDLDLTAIAMRRAHGKPRSHHATSRWCLRFRPHLRRHEWP